MKNVIALSLLLAANGASAWSPDRNDPSWPIEAIGRSCADIDVDAPSDLRWYCDAQGRVAGVRMDYDDFAVDLTSAAAIGEAGDPPPVRRRWLRVHERGGLLFVRNASCHDCARMLGDAYVISLAAMRDADLAEVQRALGLGDRPLRTARAWRAAL